MDQNDQVGNFHLQFLINLSRFLGFYPDRSTIDAPYFNLFEGAFSSHFSNESSLNNSLSEALKMFLGTNFDNSKGIKLDKNLKIELIKSMIHYYRLHLNSFP